MTDAQLNTSGAIRKAFELARSGQLQLAEQICSEVLRRQADFPEALLLRGAIEVQTGRTAAATASLQRCLQTDPARVSAHVLLGDALLALGRPEQAVESYAAALRLDPGLTAAHYGLGNALLDLQRPLEALQSYDRVLVARPTDAQALFNRGNALFQTKDLNAALESYDRAIAARSSYAAAHANRGAVLMLMRRTEAALESFDTALAVTPALPEALYQRASALRELRRWQEALETFDRNLKAQPGHLESLLGRGDVLRELGRPAGALADFDQALQLRPGCVTAMRGRGDALLDMGWASEALAAHDAALQLGGELAETLNSRGNSLRTLLRFEESVACYEESSRLDPHNPAPHYNCGTAYMRWGDHVDESLTSYLHVLRLNPRYPCVAGTVSDLQRTQADWSVIAPAASRETIIESVYAHRPVIAPFAFLSVADSAAAQLRCARRFTEDQCAPSACARQNVVHRHQRIRMAYVSADLREHAVSYLMAGVFERHDRERFEVNGISLRPAEPGAVGERIKNAFDRFIDVSAQPDAKVAALMRDMEIDIAVDLGGFTDGFRPRVFAERAAPIQVNYLGYPGTMGAPFMDYLIADRFILPPGLQAHYSEQVVYLPDCFQANDDLRALCERPPSRGGQGLPADAFVFCCLNNSHKINPAMFDIWMRLLARFPGSALWLLGETEAVRENLRREAVNRGVAAERLIFAARAPYAEHLSRLKLADLYLDTLPFNAGATASDVLWAGLPLLTCAGEAYAARMAGSLLHAIGLPELITFDLERYEAKAVELAMNPQLLGAMRSRLAQNRECAALFDTDRFRRHLEAAYTEMWSRNESGLEPAGFSVASIPADTFRGISGPTNCA
jgi:protein O-GlcNAc transferase